MAQLAKSQTKTKKMIAAEYFAMPETTQPIQLIDGEVIEMPSPFPEHQDIVGDAFVMLKQIQHKKNNGKAYISPLDVVFDEENVPQPDIFWIAADGKCEIKDKRFYGAPDLIIEVLSPSTARIDKREKFLLYEKYGVREYWLIDPVAAYVEVWQLDRGKFVRAGVFAPEDSYTSPVLNEIILFKDIFVSSKSESEE